MNNRVDFKSKYFTNSIDAVHVEDDYVQQMINEVVGSLKKDLTEHFHFIATGDTFVLGMADDEAKEINIIVSQNYDEACLLYDEESKEWAPVDWLSAENENKTPSKEELLEHRLNNLENLVTKILKQLERPNYDPRKEV